LMAALRLAKRLYESIKYEKVRVLEA